MGNWHSQLIWKSVSSVIPGEMCAESIKSSDGKLVVKSGQILSAEDIQNLKRAGVKNLWVRESLIEEPVVSPEKIESAKKEIVEKRGHKVEKVKELPIVVSDKIEDVKKTKDIEKILSSLGLDEELERVKKKKVRAGKGKMRGRKYKSKVGPLIVVSGKCDLQKSARNIPGVEVRVVSRLNAEALAPGTDYGRLTLWSKSAIEQMKEKQLFM